MVFADSNVNAFSSPPRLTTIHEPLSPAEERVLAHRISTSDSETRRQRSNEI